MKLFGNGGAQRVVALAVFKKNFALYVVEQWATTALANSIIFCENSRLSILS